MRFMYFGTRNKMRWVKVDAPGRVQETLGHSESLPYLNGGVAMRESAGSHQEYTLTWNSMTAEQARNVTEYAHGIYGDLIYFVDPVAAEQNVLNPAWSAPGVTAKDGVPLAGDKRPRVVRNLDLSRDYPMEMARYDLGAGDTRRKFYIPIPPGYTAHVGAHGDADSTIGLSIQQIAAGTPVGSPSELPILPTSTTQRFNGAFTAPGASSGIEVSIAPGAGFCSLAGVMAQILPNGRTPGFGGFILGQGASGARFQGKPRATPYSTYHDRYGLSVKLVEVEEWL